MNYYIKRIEPFGVLVESNQPNLSVSRLDVDMLRELFCRDSLIVLRGFQTFDDSQWFADYCESWGEISVWPFGKVLELVEHETPEDHIFDSNYVPMHWDGMYRPQVPEYQIFHCVEAPMTGKGGRTTFSNTTLALEHASLEAKTMWAQVTGIYQRKMAFYHSKTVSPIIDKHPYRDISVIRYNEPPKKEDTSFLNPPDLEFTGLSQEALECFHQSLQQALYHPKNFYAHEWQTGDIVIADNFSLLHGREAFCSKSPRHIRRVHVLSAPPFNNPGLESYQ